jgi:tryptophan-rich sensory protein
MAPPRTSALAWLAIGSVYAAGQGASAALAQRLSRRSTRRIYTEFAQPPYAPPGVVFPVVWSALNVTTTTAAWRIWQRSPSDEAMRRERREALAWWGAAAVIRCGYTPLAFGQRRLWAATADAALLCGAMTRFAIVARRLDAHAAAWAAPEIAWTAFATVLSTDVARRNT